MFWFLAHTFLSLILLFVFCIKALINSLYASGLKRKVNMQLIIQVNADVALCLLDNM